MRYQHDPIFTNKIMTTMKKAIKILTVFLILPTVSTEAKNMSRSHYSREHYSPFSGSSSLQVHRVVTERKIDLELEKENSAVIIQESPEPSAAIPVSEINHAPPEILSNTEENEEGIPVEVYAGIVLFGVLLTFRKHLFSQSEEVS